MDKFTDMRWKHCGHPADIYLFKAIKRNTRKRRRPDFFIVNFEHISHLFLVFLFMNLNKEM